MTGVLQKIEYSTATDSVVGFIAPLIDGIPVSRAYQAKTFDELKMSCENEEVATLLNIHMFEPRPTIDNSHTVSKPFLLSAYGASGKFTALDVINRWFYILENCLTRNVRVIGFSTGKPYMFLEHGIIELFDFRC